MPELISENTLQVSERSSYRQGARAVVPEGKGQKIKVRLMGWEPGATVVEGSSADYPVDRIVRDFPESFPVGTRMRANHDSMCEAGGDVRRIMAKTISAPWQEADGMYANALVREGEATEFVQQFADVIGTSISTAVEIESTPRLDAEGNPELDENGEPILVPKRSERGAVIVERFLTMSESPYNSVDFVEVPGADGAVVNLALESAKQLVNHTMLREASSFAIGLAGVREKTSPAAGRGAKPTVEASAEEKEGEHMDEAVLKAIEALSTRVDAFVNESQTAKGAAAQAQVDAEALESARTDAVSAYKESVAAIDAADLLEPTAEALKDRAAKGEDITSAIESAKAADAKYLEAAAKRVAEADAEDAPVYGRIREGAGDTKSAAAALPKSW